MKWRGKVDSLYLVLLTAPNTRTVRITPHIWKQCKRKLPGVIVNHRSSPIPQKIEKIHINEGKEMEVCEVIKCHVEYMIVVGKRNKTPWGHPSSQWRMAYLCGHFFIINILKDSFYGRKCIRKIYMSWYLQKLKNFTAANDAISSVVIQKSVRGFSPFDTEILHHLLVCQAAFIARIFFKHCTLYLSLS